MSEELRKFHKIVYMDDPKGILVCNSLGTSENFDKPVLEELARMIQKRVSEIEEELDKL